MAADVIVEVDVQDKDRYTNYKRMVPPTLAAYGGRFLLVRGCEAQTLECGWSPGQLVILVFPPAERVKA